MGVTTGLLLAKTLALSLMDIGGRLGLPGGAQTSVDVAPSLSDLPEMLSNSIDMIRNLTSCGQAEQAYSLIFPGTLWCGKGTKAKSFDELGLFRGPDTCCRDHDHCPDTIGSHATGHGLRNERTVISLLCACDHKFLHCLRREGSVIAREIGRLYFDFLDPVCMTFDYPVRRCKRRARGSSHRCLQYEYDVTLPPQWYFQDFPFFYALHLLSDEEDISTEAAAALAGQQRPDVVANGGDAELWSALLMNRHVRFGTRFGDNQMARGGGNGWEAVIGEQVFPGAD